MKGIFIVHHSYQLDNAASSEETKLIGVYSSKLKAQQAIRRLRKQPGFKRLPTYFSIDEYWLDQVNWEDGFISKKYTPLFSVWRRDRARKIHLVKAGLVEADALRLVRDLKREHKNQTIWAKEHA